LLDKQQEEQHWLIEGLWARSAIGLIGGAPKCCNLLSAESQWQLSRARRRDGEGCRP
jgi:hypothetical protein